MFWNCSTSCSFKTSQGVRHGAILSPFLYSIYVNDLLHQLSVSGYGATNDGTFCGSLMYADDLALIANSSTDLQAMLEIVFSYSVQWRYQLNAQKSVILIFGESAATLARNRPSRQWLKGSEVIPEKVFDLSPHPLTLIPQSAAVPQEGPSSPSMPLVHALAASTHLHPCACTKHTASPFSWTGMKCGLSHRQN